MVRTKYYGIDTSAPTRRIGTIVDGILTVDFKNGGTVVGNRIVGSARPSADQT